MTDRSWVGLHLFLRWRPDQVDRLLTGALGPLMAGWVAGGRIDDWFFIRYGDGGPHLRIRARGEAMRHGSSRDALRQGIAALVESTDEPAMAIELTRFPPLPGPTPWPEHGGVLEIAYEPEVERYGGPVAMPVAEDVFGWSTQVVLDLLSAPFGPGGRLVQAVQLGYATALGLGLDDLSTMRWLRRHAAAWRAATLDPADRAVLLPPAAMLAQVAHIAATQAAPLEKALRRVRDDVDRGDGPLGQWAGRVAEANRRLTTSDSPHPSWLGIWGSHLHMACNRLGVAPDEERAVCWLLADVLGHPVRPDEFRLDRATAADRRYLEASRIRAGQAGVALAPASSPSSVDTDEPAQREPDRIILPVGPAQPGDLATALRARSSVRRLAGPLDASELAAVIALATGDPERRAFPSAGGLYPTRLRLIVNHVDGVPAGCYRVDPTFSGQCQLVPFAPALDPAELLALSMWFQPEAAGADVVDVSSVPAILVLSTRLTQLRAKYGLRALRFALLEAGHLAQNLALVTAGLGLGLVTIGGFYDDLVHELIGIDGIDEAVQYLLPIGRPAG